MKVTLKRPMVVDLKPGGIKLKKTNMNKNDINWGNLSEDWINLILNEINNKIYTRVFDVEENDIVLDIGSMIGEFTFQFLKNKPKHCYVIEPLKTNFDLLNSNLQGLPVSFYNVGIGDVNEIKQLTLFLEKPQDCQILKFSTFLKISNLTKIDFMKSDCEGCEYDIYTNENIEILKKIPKLVGEFHLSGNDFKNKFRYFRDNILNQFSTFEVFSVDGCDIKYWFYTDKFIDFYTEIILHIQNYETNQ